jgi:hypothetical protein
MFQPRIEHECFALLPGIIPFTIPRKLFSRLRTQDKFGGKVGRRVGIAEKI